MGINQKILDIQKTVEVEKTGFDERNEYYYFRAEDVLNSVRVKLNAVGVITRTRIVRWEQENFYDSNGRGRPRTTAEVEVTYIDAETGEEYPTSVLATGSDIGGDKGPRKLATQAKKISLIDTFLIGEGIEKFDSDNDPEQEAVNVSDVPAATVGANAQDLAAEIGELIRGDNPIDAGMVKAVGDRIAKEAGIEADQKAWRKDGAVMAAVVVALKNGEVE